MNEIQDFQQLANEFESIEKRARIAEIQSYKRRIARLEDEEDCDDEIAQLQIWITDLKRDT